MSIHSLAVVEQNAHIGKNVTIGPFSVIGADVSIGDDTEIGSHVVIEGWTEIGERCSILTGAVIGSPPQDLKYQGEHTRVVIGNDNMFREYITINRGSGGGGGITKIGNHAMMMAYSHVAHDCQLGDHVIIGNCAALSGHIDVEDFAIIGGLSGVHQFTRIGAHCIIGGCSGIPQDVPPYMMASGARAKIYGLNNVGLKRRNFPAESVKALQQAYRILFRSKKSIKHALEQVKAEIQDCPEVEHLVEFIEGSQRGICHGASRE